MKNWIKLVKKIVLFILPLLLFYFVESGELKAQDKGPAVLQQVGLYTAGGAVGGAVLGLAVFLADPQAPSANVQRSTLVGFGIGSVIGLLFGTFQATRQAVLPDYMRPAPSQSYQGRLFPPVEEVDFLAIRKDEQMKRNSALVVMVPFYQWDF